MPTILCGRGWKTPPYPALSVVIASSTRPTSKIPKLQAATLTDRLEAAPELRVAAGQVHALMPPRTAVIYVRL